MTDDVILRMEGITKEFPGVKALDNVNLEVKRGEVHILLGENGAGKSTLMKILTGVYERDSGQVIFKGKPFKVKSFREAQDAGISIIYQEFNLIPYLSIAENIFIGREPVNKAGLIDWSKMNSEAKRILNSLGVHLNPKEIVASLGVAQQQMIEIAKALSVDAYIIVMDEPTAALTEKEIKELFKAIKQLKSQGRSIIYISHRLEEVHQIGDRATVLRDGQYVGTVDLAETSIDKLISMMVGRTLTEKFPKKVANIGEDALVVRNLSRKGKLYNISFHVRKGEILGVAGLMGAGRTELMRAIFGADPKDSGEIYIDGKKVEIHSPHDAIKYGIGFLTEDRKEQGLVLDLSVRENITLANIGGVMDKMFVNKAKEEEICKKYIANLFIKTPSPEQKVKFLSGGNQQKVVLAKWLFTKSKVLIFDEPTRGIDVKAKVEIYKLMNQLAEQGVAIIMISSELPEILGMSDRIIVMHEGRITGELTREEATQEKIMHYATGGDKVAS